MHYGIDFGVASPPTVDFLNLTPSTLLQKPYIGAKSGPFGRFWDIKFYTIDLAPYQTLGLGLGLGLLRVRVRVRGLLYSYSDFGKNNAANLHFLFYQKKPNYYLGNYKNY